MEIQIVKQEFNTSHRVDLEFTNVDIVSIVPLRTRSS